MSAEELSAKTVIELRRIAREMGVPLKAGISKAGIVECLCDAFAKKEQEEKPQHPQAAAEVEKEAVVRPVEAPMPVQPQTAPQAQPAAGGTQFRMAWQNPAPRYNSRQPVSQPPRPAATMNNSWGSSVRPLQQQDPAPRTGTRPVGYTSRFGPGAVVESTQPQNEGYRGFRAGNEQMNRPTPERRYEPEQTSYPSYNETPRSYGQRSVMDPPVQDPVISQPSQAELMTPLECSDGSGILEIHPDGYGFLRSSATMVSTAKDIYISIAQIRRFSLRSGDLVTGKVRPQREGDRYAAMLYVTSVNDVPAEELTARTPFDEMTPAYPDRRLNLQSSAAGRMIDLVAPIGFGSRALLLCPPETGKEQLLITLANTITDSNPEAAVMLLLVEELPEDVTMYREKAKCQVIASTFDQTPDTHLRLADLAMERAQRLAEQGKDVVLLVDSLTRLSKVFTTSNAQQGRALPGMVSPSSLYRAKKLFGTARRLTEGGSVTIIGTMNVENGSKVDDSVVEEFRSTANTVVALDASVTPLGVVPPMNLTMTSTRRLELFSTEAQQEGYQMIQNSVLRALPQHQALQQLQHFVEKTTDNDELFVKLKSWVEMARGGK